MPVVELRVDRNLVCPNFDGYKLSFDPIPVMRDELEVQPSRLEPSFNQYSLLHLELFARHNLLWADPWMRHNNYFVDARHQVLQCIYDPQIGRSRGLRVVYTMENRDHGDGHAQLAGDYNYSMCFISERFCVICDGITTFHLLDTGDRSRPSTEQWQLVTRTPVDSEGGRRGYIMYDARLDMIQERKQISLVAGHVSRRPVGCVNPAANQAHQTHVFFLDLAWARWTLDPFTNEWKYNICQRLETTGTLQYCAFEPRAESLILASTRKIETPEEREAAEIAAAAAAADPPPTPPPEDPQNGHAAHADDAEDDGDAGEQNYTWTQSNTEVSLRFPLPETATRNDITVRYTSTFVEVTYSEQMLISGDLYLPVNAEAAIPWLLEESALTLTLVKHEQNVMWPKVLKLNDGSYPAAVGDAEGMSDGAALPIPNLEDPIEECDLGAFEDDLKMVRFNLPAGKITHTIYLGTTPVLFVTDLRPGFPAAFATRQGVDASVWLQMYQPSRPDEWSVRHEGQMHAFGYVQASKAQRKFTACCPDFEYTVICESRRHVILYRPRHGSAEGLRKRNGPPVVVGKQNLINLDEDVGDILGVSTASNVVTILTETAVLHLQVQV